MNPDPLTLRELMTMADAGGRERWNHTSHLLALMANANRNPKKKPGPFLPSDFNPYHDNGEPKRKSIDCLRALFPGAK